MTYYVVWLVIIVLIFLHLVNHNIQKHFIKAIFCLFRTISKDKVVHIVHFNLVRLAVEISKNN